MADPTGSGLGKAAGELMKEMQKAQSEISKLEKQGNPSGSAQGGADFAQKLDSMRVQEVQKTDNIQATKKAANILARAKIDAQSPTMRVGETAKTERSKIASMLESMVNGQDKMTEIMNMALSGRQFSPPELIAMQAGVYKFTQELELTSKVIEKATSGVKQTMNTQV